MNATLIKAITASNSWSIMIHTQAHSVPSTCSLAAGVLAGCLGIQVISSRGQKCWHIRLANDASLLLSMLAENWCRGQCDISTTWPTGPAPYCNNSCYNDKIWVRCHCYTLINYQSKLHMYASVCSYLIIKFYHKNPSALGLQAN